MELPLNKTYNFHLADFSFVVKITVTKNLGDGWYYAHEPKEPNKEFYFNANAYAEIVAVD